jgi:hypothetical protein
MKFIFIIFAVLLTSACQSTAHRTPDPSLNSSNSAQVIVYRPKSDWMGAAVEFRAYADDILIGTLTPGSHVNAFIPAGKSTIKVQGHFVGFPDGIPGKRELMLLKGETYYFRFTQQFDGFVVGSGVIIPRGGLSLLPVSTESFSERK